MNFNPYKYMYPVPVAKLQQRERKRDVELENRGQINETKQNYFHLYSRNDISIFLG